MTLITTWKRLIITEKTKTERAVSDFASFLRFYECSEVVCAAAEKGEVEDFVTGQLRDNSLMNLKNDTLKKLIGRCLVWLNIDGRKVLYVDNSGQTDLNFQLVYCSQSWFVKSQPGLQLWEKRGSLGRHLAIVKSRE